MDRRSLIAGGLLLAAAAVPAGSDSSMRVLFIGNSYTFFNDLPALLENMARAAGTRIKTRAVTMAGSSLRGHWIRGQALAAIREGGWNWVVLQEQSSLGVPLLVDGIPRITDERRFHAYVRRFDREIRAIGARTMLLLTWSARNAPEEQGRLNHAYLSIAKALGATVAPAGMAWSIVREENPEVSLYTADGSHPARAGSYLAACSVFAALTELSPERLPAGIAGRDAPLLQRAAWRAHRQLAEAGGYLEYPAPAPPVLPQPPPGRRPQPAELAGSWTGNLRLYRSPAEMQLRLVPRGELWSARMSLAFNGKHETPALLREFSLTPHGVRFAGRAQPSGVVRFRGVLTSDGELAGVAEVIASTGSRTAVGTWTLRREP